MPGSDSHKDDYLKGRGAQINPQNKFEQQAYVQEFAEGIDDWEKTAPKTNFHEQEAKTVINKVESFDVPIEWSINPYQGCEHGCIYCYARPTHEYWGYSAGTDFESNIIVKHNAAQKLEELFEKKTWQAATISLCGNTDPYQPAERKFKLSRKILEVCLAYKNPIGIITKNALILRDLDILQELQKYNLVHVFTSITATDEKLRLQLEPRTSTYADRFRVLEMLSAYDIPTGIMNAPIIPGINDHEMPRVLQRAHNAGAKWAGYTIVRLNGPVAALFENWLIKNFPDRADKVLNAIRSCHDGQLGDTELGRRTIGEGKIAEVIAQQFKLYCKKYNFKEGTIPLSTEHFRRKGNGQLDLFS